MGRKEIYRKGIGIRTTEVILTTLNNGSSRILVRDSECHFFNANVPYDGSDESLFCFSDGCFVTRELFDTIAKTIMPLCGVDW